MIFLVEGCFEWVRNELMFGFTRKDATHWGYGKFEGAGTYSINVIYENPYPDWQQASWGDNPSFTLMPKTPRNYRLPSEPIKIEDVWVGEIFTSPLEFHLIQN